MSETIRVHSYRRCPFAMRVRMTLHEKGLPFDCVEESLKDKSKELLELHPEGRVPVLVHGNLPIYESSIITQYLDDAFPDKPLMPKDPKERMEVRRWTYWCDQIFKPEIDRFKYGKARLTEEEYLEGLKLSGECAEELNNALSGKEWLVGNVMTLADIHVFPFYRQFSKVAPEHPELGRMKNANNWLERILLRPAFEKTMQKKA